MRRWLLACLGGVCLAMGSGCGAAYHASSGVKFDIDGGKEIDDADIQKAFAASPQMGERVRVAYYTFDDTKAKDVEAMLATVPNVASVYRIPSMILSGKRRFDESSRYGAQPQDLSIKKLRLLSARAHADVLVVFDNGWRGGGVNGLIGFSALIVPIFFVPAFSNKTESYAQAYVMDVRNGFLYGEATAERKDGQDFVTMWAKSPQDLADDQWPKVLGAVKEQLRDKLRPTPVAPTAAPEKQADATPLEQKAPATTP